MSIGKEDVIVFDGDFIKGFVFFKDEVVKIFMMVFMIYGCLGCNWFYYNERFGKEFYNYLLVLKREDFERILRFIF